MKSTLHNDDDEELEEDEEEEADSFVTHNTHTTIKRVG